MTQQYLRSYSLVVAPENGQQALDLSQFHMKFSIHQGDIQTPNVMNVRIYNVSEQTAQRLQNKPTSEFSRVVLQGGYEGSAGIIFDGNIKYVRSGHETAVDSYIDIVAADGDAAYNFAGVNVTLAAGWTPNDVINACLQAMGSVSPPVVAGSFPDYSALKGLRAKVLYGICRDILRETARSVGASCSIQNGRLNFVPLAGALPGDAVELTSASGLIGFPVQTANGINVRSLLNPRIGPAGTIQVNNASIQPYAYPIGLNAAVANQVVPRTAEDGFYRVIWIEHTGDTRGNPWYSDMICVALDPSANDAGAAIAAGLVFPPAQDVGVTVPQ